LAREWVCFCELFGQDPRGQGDIIELILNGESADESRLSREPYDDSKAEDAFDSVAKHIDGIRQCFKTGPGVALEAFGERANRDPTAETTSPKMTQEAAFEIIVNQMSYEKYEERWIGYHLPNGATRTARKFPELSYDKVSGRFKRYLAKKKKIRS